MRERTRIRFWSGLRTIGGTIVTVEHGEDRIVFDFGRSFSPAGNWLEHEAQGDESPVTTYLRLGILPPVDGLYEQRYIPENMNLAGAGQSLLNTKVLISHLHLDHMAMMGMIAAPVPVVMTDESLRLYEALEAAGEGVTGKRDYQGVPFQAAVDCGCIQVTPYRVDHDIPGACAFRIETPEVRIVYTGDLKLHGSHPEWTLEMAEKAREWGAQILIIEGTTIGLEDSPPSGKGKISPEVPDSLPTERQLRERIEEVLNGTEGAVFFNLYHRNTERIQAFSDAADHCGRKLVLEPATAILAERLLKLDRIHVLDCPGMKRKGMEEPVAYPKISPERIAAHPSEYLVQNSFDNLSLLLKLNVRDAAYIHSNGAPLGSYDPSYAVLIDVLKRLSVPCHSIGSSGHAIPDHLYSIAETIRPELLIPLHSLYPERFSTAAGLRLLPEYGKTYEFLDGKLAYGEM